MSYNTSQGFDYTEAGPGQIKGSPASRALNLVTLQFSSDDLVFIVERLEMSANSFDRWREMAEAKGNMDEACYAESGAARCRALMASIAQAGRGDK